MKHIIWLLILIIPSNYNYSQVENLSVTGNNEFAYDLLLKLKEKKPGDNLFFSPFSISSALAMTYAGARNETKIQICKTFHFNSDQESLCDDYQLLLEKIEKNNNFINLLIANSLWAQNGYHFLDNYLLIVNSKFNSSLMFVNFENSIDRESARKEINKWTESKTNNKIKEIIQPDALDNLTKLVLVNAIYFKASWKLEFDKSRTTKAKFFYNNNFVETDFMKETAQFNYYENDTLQILEMPYKQCHFSMLVLLPRKQYGLEMVENNINIHKYFEYFRLLNSQNVEVYFPKFKTVLRIFFKTNSF